MGPDLATTNTLLGVMAVVSVLEAVVLVAILVGGYAVYRRVSAILDDVRTTTTHLKDAAQSAGGGVRQFVAWLARWAA